MKALIRGERLGTVGIVAGLFGVICLLIASLGLNIAHHSDLDRLQDLIYTRCVQLATPQNQARQVEVVEWSALAEQERHNPYIDPKLRVARTGSYQRLADAMQAAVEASQRNACDQYKRALPAPR